MSATPKHTTHGEWLTRDEQAERLGVAPASIPKLARRYRPTSPNRRFASNPYPTHVEGQHKPSGLSVLVLDTALQAWDQRRRGTRGRPPRAPGELSIAQLRALRAVASGGSPVPRDALVLLDMGYVRHRLGVGLVVTAQGAQYLAERDG